MPYFNYSDDVRLYYEEHGDPTSQHVVTFLNGVMASAASWAWLWPVFERAQFRCVALDFKGQLKSSKPAGPYTFAQHSEETKALLEHIGVKKTHLVGTSYGGEVAMKMAILYPDFVESISLIDSVSELDPVLRGFVLGWKTLCDTGDGETFFWGMAPSIYGPEFLETHHDMLAARAKAIKDNPMGYLEGQKILYDAFAGNVYMTDQLHLIRCPALILCGEKDILKPPKFSKILETHIPDAEYITLPDSGHVAIFERPRELESAIFGFIMKHII